MVAFGTPASSNRPVTMCTTLCHPLTSSPRNVPRSPAPPKLEFPKNPRMPTRMSTAPTRPQNACAGEGEEIPRRALVLWAVVAIVRPEPAREPRVQTRDADDENELRGWDSNPQPFD